MLTRQLIKAIINRRKQMKASERNIFLRIRQIIKPLLGKKLKGRIIDYKPKRFLNRLKNTLKHSTYLIIL